jgi:hypothetical protein
VDKEHVTSCAAAAWRAKMELQQAVHDAIASGVSSRDVAGWAGISHQGALDIWKQFSIVQQEM